MQTKKKRVSHSLEWETSGTYQRDESSSHGRDRQWTRVRKRAPHSGWGWLERGARVLRKKRNAVRWGKRRGFQTEGTACVRYRGVCGGLFAVAGGGGGVLQFFPMMKGEVG